MPNTSIRNQTKACLACGKRQTDRCHIRSKGAGGDWDDENILYLCREHHSLSHNLGWDRFCAKFPSVEVELNARGFFFEDVFGVRKLVKNG